MKNVFVIGAGTMGLDIAQVFATAGLQRYRILAEPMQASANPPQNSQRALQSALIAAR